MDPSSPQNREEPDRDISSLVNEFLDRRHAGENLTPDDFAAAHPELADKLRFFLEGLPLIEKARDKADAASAQESSSMAETSLLAIEGYELIDKIGRGGMGAVYKARQISTKRVVALKVMLGGPFASGSAQRRFEREVELAARLEHPSIVQVLESGEVAGQRYYAMGYVAGVQLNDYLTASMPDLGTTLDLFARICEAVDYAHSRGVIHRDLKPANVLVDDEGNAHILDFGLAKATDQADTKESLTTCVSLPGQVVGTLSYLSPEQAAGNSDAVDTRTDVFALGVMLYQALTGSLPYDTRGSPSEVIRRIQQTPPTRPSSCSGRVDREIETIILKALEKEKERRYQSAKEIADDLRRYLAGEPILAQPPSSFYRLRKKLRKHRLRVGFAAALTVVLLIGLVFVTRESRSRRLKLTSVRQEAARHTWLLTSPADSRDLTNAQRLYSRSPQLPEAGLVWAQAQFRNEDTRESAILFLEGRLRAASARWAYRALLAEIYESSGDVARAKTLRAEAERDLPDTPEAQYLRSFTTLDLAHAILCAEQAIERCAATAMEFLAWQRLTYLRLETSDLEGAMHGVDRLIALAERGGFEAEKTTRGNRDYWIGFKGHILTRRGQVHEAIDCYTEVGDYIHRAAAYRRIKEYERAVDDYTREIQKAGHQPPDVYDLYQRATPLWILGRTEEALEDYQQVRVLLGRPFYSDARRFLILRQVDRPDDAQAVLDAALRDVDKPSWLHQILRCLAGEIAPEELVAAGAALNDHESLCEAYYYAGEVHLASGDLPIAKENFRLCVRTGVDHDLDAERGVPIPMNEYELAQWRLDTAFPEAAPTSQP